MKVADLIIALQALNPDGDVFASTLPDGRVAYSLEPCPFLNEVWLPVPGYLGLYEVSDFGRVRSLRAVARNTNRLRDVPLILVTTKCKRTGYIRVGLSSSLGVRRMFCVHALVLMAFVGPRPPGHVGAHENGKRDQNRLSNLFWKTHKENSADMERHGTRARGEINKRSKLTTEQVLAIRAEGGERGNLTRLGKKYGVTPTTISNVQKRVGWKHV